jgi:hypothetical protein
VEIEVTPGGGGWTCEVSFEDRSRVSRHTVTVTRADLERWGRGHGEAAVSDLVRRSFEFLLRREPASSILRRFELSVIPSYFPDYDLELKP